MSYALKQVPFSADHGMDTGLLVDCLEGVGRNAMISFSEDRAQRVEVGR